MGGAATSEMMGGMGGKRGGRAGGEGGGDGGGGRGGLGGSAAWHIRGVGQGGRAGGGVSVSAWAVENTYQHQVLHQLLHGMNHRIITAWHMDDTPCSDNHTSIPHCII